jgi:hypothetical protein
MAFLVADRFLSVFVFASATYAPNPQRPGGRVYIG